MIDIKLIRTDPEMVKENMRKKFQHDRVSLVDEVLDLDRKYREAIAEADRLRAERNQKSKAIGALMAQGKREEAEAAKAEVSTIGPRLEAIEAQAKVRGSTVCLERAEAFIQLRGVLSF